MAAVDDAVTAAQQHLNDLKSQGSAGFGGAPGAYDQALSAAQQALNAAVRAQGTASKPAPAVKLSPGQTLLNDDGSVKYTAPGKPDKPPTPLKLSPGQTAYGPDGSVIATGPARTPMARVDSPGQTETADAAKAKGEAAVTRAGAYAGWTQARIDAAKQGAWAKVQPQIDAIDAQVLAGAITKEQGDTAKQGLIDATIQDTVTGMTAPQRSTAAYQQARSAVDEGNSRATDAASIYNNQTSQANDAAQHGSFVAGSVLANRLAAAPGFQANMGGAPLLTQDQKAQIGANLLAGGSKADAMNAIAQAHQGNLAVVNAASGPFDPNAGAQPLATGDPNVPDPDGPITTAAPGSLGPNATVSPWGQPLQRFEAAGGVRRVATVPSAGFTAAAPVMAANPNPQVVDSRYAGQFMGV